MDTKVVDSSEVRLSQDMKRWGSSWFAVLSGLAPAVSALARAFQYLPISTDGKDEEKDGRSTWSSDPVAIHSSGCGSDPFGESIFEARTVILNLGAPLCRGFTEPCGTGKG